MPEWDKDYARLSLKMFFSDCHIKTIAGMSYLASRNKYKLAFI